MLTPLLTTVVLLAEIVSKVAGGRPVHDCFHELAQRRNEPVDKQNHHQ